MKTIDFNKQFKTLLKTEKFKSKIDERLNIKDDMKVLNPQVAFRNSMLKNYPEIPREEEEKVITIYAAALLLSEYLSENTMRSYVKKKVFRKNKDGKLYLFEVKKYKELMDFVSILYGEFAREEEVLNQKRIVLYPPVQNKHGLNYNDQKLRSIMYITKEKWFIDLRDSLDLSL